MSAPTRPAMRLLSARLLHLHRARLPPSQIRNASRYSNPARRSFTAAPSQPSFFVDPAGEDAGSRTHPTDPPRNPLDPRAVQLAAEEKRQYHLHRMRYAGIGMILSLLGLAVTVWNLDLDDMEQTEAGKQKTQGKVQLDASSDANAQFQGREVHIIGAGEGKRVVAQGKGAEIELVETGTSSVPHFPRTIYLPSESGADPNATDATPGLVSAAQPNSAANPGNAGNLEEYTLLGLGIRTVSFLSIQVYVVGMYVRTQDISGLQAKLIHLINPAASTLVPAEKEELKAKLLDSGKSREIWSELLKIPGMKTAFRITPTRNTDFMHLRDGWVTGINKRTAEAKHVARTSTPGGESEYESEAFGQAMRAFMGLFAGGKAPKGSVMILSRDQQGVLDVYFQDKQDGAGKEKAVQHLGKVDDERIGRLIWMNYLAGDKVSSEAARKGVVEGCMGFASRPVGSIETMVT